MAGGARDGYRLRMLARCRARMSEWLDAMALAQTVATGGQPPMARECDGWRLAESGGGGGVRKAEMTASAQPVVSESQLPNVQRLEAMASVQRIITGCRPPMGRRPPPMARECEWWRLAETGGGGGAQRVRLTASAQPAIPESQLPKLQRRELWLLLSVLSLNATRRWEVVRRRWLGNVSGGGGSVW